MSALHRINRSLTAMAAAALVLAAWGPAAAENGPARTAMSELEQSGLLARFGISAGAGDQAEPSLNSYLWLALSQNQMLQSQYAEYLASYEAIAEARALPDPRLGYTEYLQSVETRVGPQERAVTLSQSFPWFGSLSLQGEMKQARSAAALARFHNAALELMADVKKAYYDLGYLERATAITGAHIGLLSQWENVAQARYSAGSGRYTDVIKAQVELGVLSNRLAELEDQRRPQAAVLNALLNRAAAAPVLLAGAPAADLPDWDPADLAARMMAANPMLAAWGHMAEESMSAERLTRKQGYPSFTLGVNYILTGEARMPGVMDSGKDPLMATIGLSLPVWRGKYSAATRAAVNRYQAAMSSRRELNNNLGAALERTHFRYRDARRKLELYRTALLPKGHQSLGATRTSYEAGHSSFLDLMDAQRMVLEFELSLARAEFEALTQEAMLEKLVGDRLTANQP